MSSSSSTNINERPHHPPPPPANSKTSTQSTDLNDEDRLKYVLDTFLQNFSDSMRLNPKGWRGRFRKMSADEFAFYRGAAVLFYRDLFNQHSQDRWVVNCAKASSIFIHGDLHAGNFGTYIDRFGIINFDVNDFDEGYIGPFTWDVKRLLVSLNIIAFSKAFCDKKIEKILECVLRAYLTEIYAYCQSPEKRYEPICSENTTGHVNLLLKKSRLGSKEEHLDKMTYIENYERKFIRSDTITDVDDVTRHQLLLAFQEYIQTIPTSKKEANWAYKVQNEIVYLIRIKNTMPCIIGKRYCCTFIARHWIGW